MGLDTFHRIDFAQGAPEGPQCLVTVAGSGWPAEQEALFTVQAMIKLTCLGLYAKQRTQGGQPTRLELLSFGEPPEPLVNWLRDAGVECNTRHPDRAEPEPSLGRPAGVPTTPDGHLDLALLMEANARRFAQEHALPFPPRMEALDLLDAIISARREEAGVEPEEPAPDLRDGHLVVLAGAYAGEAAKGRYGGHWVLDPNHDLPLVFAAGPEGTVVVNLLGKVAKFLINGESDSVASLVRALHDYVNR